MELVTKMSKRKYPYIALGVVILLLTALGLVCSGQTSEWAGYPRFIDLSTTTSPLTAISTQDSKYYPSYAARAYLAANVYSYAGSAHPLYITQEQLENLVVGKTYTFEVEQWSNGFGPYYVLRSYKLYLEEKQ